MKILKAIGIIVLFLVIYLLAQLLVGLGASIIYMVGLFMATAATGVQLGLEDIVEQMSGFIAEQTPMVLLISIAFTLPIYYLFYRRRRQELMTFVSVRRISPISVPVLVLLGVSASFVLDMILSILSQFEYFNQVFDTYDQVSEVIFGGGFLLTLISVGIVGPVFEEILFRGLIFGELRKITKVKAALFIQAVLFGLYHMNIVQGIYATLLGLLIGFVYYRSNSIIAPVIIHVTINSLSVIINEFVGTEQLEQWGFVIMIACVGLFFLSGAFILTSKSFKRNMDDSLYYINRPHKQSEAEGGPAAGV